METHLRWPSYLLLAQEIHRRSCANAQPVLKNQPAGGRFGPESFHRGPLLPVGTYAPACTLGGIMIVKRHFLATLAVLLAVIGLAVAGPTSAASAQTSGPESFTGFLIATGVSGERVVLATNIRARGVFNGSGKIIELPPQPGDPDNMNRDDLVFRQGTLHLLSFVQDFQIVSFNPNSCRFAVTITQTTQFAGGTGIFAEASGTGTGQVDGTGMAQRNPDGSCNLDLPPKHERDAVSGSGTLTF